MLLLRFIFLLGRITNLPCWERKCNITSIYGELCDCDCYFTSIQVSFDDLLLKFVVESWVICMYFAVTMAYLWTLLKPRASFLGKIYQFLVTSKFLIDLIFIFYTWNFYFLFLLFLFPSQDTLSTRTSYMIVMVIFSKRPRTMIYKTKVFLGLNSHGFKRTLCGLSKSLIAYNYCKCRSKGYHTPW